MSDCVYLMVDKDEDLLYIGRTANVPNRFAQHAGQKPWWGEIDQIKVIHLDNPIAADRAERSLIRLLQPRWNVVGNERAVCTCEHSEAEEFQWAVCLDCGEITSGPPGFDPWPQHSEPVEEVIAW